MEKASDGIWRVPSDSSPNKIYLVDIGTDIPTCTCTAFAIARNRTNGSTGRKDGGWCKHLTAVTQAYEESLEQKDLDDQVAIAGIALRERLKSLSGG